MTTRLESCTKDFLPSAPPPDAGTRAQDARSRGVRSRLAKDIALGVCVSAYLALVLFDDVESPLLSMALIVVVAYELIQPHMRNQ